MTDTTLNSYDHYVSQTYLKHFGFKKGKKDFVWMYRKKYGVVKGVPTDSICGEYSGDICEAFENKFALREILNLIEFAWNPFIEAIKNNNLLETHRELSNDDKIPFLEKILLFISYVRCLSPTMRNLSKEQNETLFSKVILPLQTKLDSRLDANDSIKKGTIKIEIGNNSYYKGQGINHLVDFAKILSKRTWVILKNSTRIKFITSDTPFISLLNRDLYLPLTPEYALIFSHFQSDKIKHYNVTAAEVENYNKNIVQWASDLVISSQENSEIKELVDKYREYKPTSKITLFPNGIITFQHQAIKSEN